MYGFVSKKGTHTQNSVQHRRGSISCPSGEKYEAQRNFAIFIYIRLPMIFAVDSLGTRYFKQYRLLLVLFGKGKWKEATAKPLDHRERT